MSKIYNVYENNLDRTWYQSSNILYSECEDKANELKTVRIVFKNGRTYEYYNVDVFDYMLFREDNSQGKAFKKHIVKYETQKVDDTNLDELQKMLEYYQEKDNAKYPNVQIINKNIVNVYLDKNTIESFRIGECEEKIDVLKKTLDILKITYNVEMSDCG